MFHYVHRLVANFCVLLGARWIMYSVFFNDFFLPANEISETEPKR